MTNEIKTLIENGNVEEIEKAISEYSKTYYTGDSLITDEEFDALVDKLSQICPESEVLSKTGWGYEPSNGKKIPHRYGLHVGSLSKIKSVSAIPESFSPEFCRISAKLDGISVVAYYENGRRVLALTRGNGNEGIDVTRKLDIISPQTKTLRIPFTGAVRGEVLCDNKTWNSLKEVRFKDNPSANSRNFTAGVMNRQGDDDKDEDLLKLRYVVYKIIADPQYRLVSRFTQTVDPCELQNMLQEFDSVPAENRLTSSWCEEYFIELFDKYCEVFPCDGLVITNLRNMTYESTGSVVYEERAYKFESESKKVVVTDIDWTASRTGRLVPRVWFDAVSLSGAMVRKCTGFNAAFIRDNKISKGAQIRVCRSGEVIPHILEVISTVGEAELPEVCPSCGDTLYWDGEDLVCSNESDRQLPYRFISVAGECHGAGYSLYSKILEVFKVEDFSSLLKFLETLKDKSVVDSKIDNEVSGYSTQNLCKTILDKIREGVDPRTFLVACNVKGLSWTVTKQLVVAYPEYLQDLSQDTVDYDRIWGISGFGSATVNTLKDYSKRIKKLLEVVTIKESAPEETIETNFTVAITGSLSIKRSDFDKLLSSKGISQSSNFKEIKYLITNNPDSTSSKMKKARENGVEIISEKEFFEKFLKQG